MTQKADIPVCVLGGGEASRFGGPKGLAPLNGVRLIEIVIRRFRTQTSGPIVVNSTSDGPYAELGIPLIPDRLDGIGPLAGVHAAMVWAQKAGFPYVATCALDVPFLPKNLLTVLSQVNGPVICASAGRWHPIIGQWPSILADDLADFVGSKPRSAHAWAEHCNAVVREFPLTNGEQDPFFNINTKEDLAKVAK